MFEVRCPRSDCGDLSNIFTFPHVKRSVPFERPRSADRPLPRPIKPQILLLSSGGASESCRRSLGIEQVWRSPGKSVPTCFRRSGLCSTGVSILACNGYGGLLASPIRYLFSRIVCVISVESNFQNTLTLSSQRPLWSLKVCHIKWTSRPLLK